MRPLTITIMSMFLVLSLTATDEALHKKASDIQSPYVGETEMRIADMFSEAHSEQAILFLDEADTFLQDRQHALRSWEFSQVNEMLVQMEHYRGIFICSTNLIHTLDKASLRRFTAKIQFDYLSVEQATRQFSALVDGASHADIAAIRNKLKGLPRQTPGDFSAAIKQLQLFQTPVSVDTLYNALHENALLKGDDMHKPMGFIC